MVTTPVGIIIAFSDVHDWNALEPMIVIISCYYDVRLLLIIVIIPIDVTVVGIVIFTNDEHEEKAEVPYDSDYVDKNMMIDCNDKIEVPMVKTPGGIIIAFSDVHEWNAPEPMIVIISCYYDVR